MGIETRQPERMQQYTKRWDKDATKDTEVHKQQRLEEYVDVVNGKFLFVNILSQANNVFRLL